MVSPVASRSSRPPLYWWSMPRQRSSSSSPARPPGVADDRISLSPAVAIARNRSFLPSHALNRARPRPGGAGGDARSSTYAILRAAMQTSLARRERRRRSGNRARRPQGGAFRRIAVILPMILLSTFVVMGAVAFVGAVDVYTTYSKDLGDPKELRSEEHTAELQSRQYLVCR